MHINMERNSQILDFVNFYDFFPIEKIANEGFPL